MLLHRGGRSARRGVTLVECAIIYPLVFLLLLGLVIGGIGIFRYQEVASLARAAARYASTHGAQYRKDTSLGTGAPGTTSGAPNGNLSSLLWYQATPTGTSGSDISWTGDIYDTAVRPNLVALVPQYLTCQVGWPPVKSPSGVVVQNQPDNWPGSTVTVTVSYQWLPDLYFIGPITLSSTSTMPITN